MLWRKSQFARAEEQRALSLDAYRQAGDAYGIALALNHLGVQLWLQGQRQRSIRVCEEGLAIAQPLDEPKLLLFLFPTIRPPTRKAGAGRVARAQR